MVGPGKCQKQITYSEVEIPKAEKQGRSSMDSFRTPPFRGHKIWVLKNVQIILFVSVTSIEGTPLFRGKGQVFWVPNTAFDFHSGDTFSTQNVSDPKEGRYLMAAITN